MTLQTTHQNCHITENHMAGITYEGGFRAETATRIALRWVTTVLYCKLSSPLWAYARFENAAKSQENQQCPR